MIQTYSAVTNNYSPIVFNGDLLFYGKDLFKHSRRNSKIYKVLPHMFLSNHTWSVWVDANIRLNISPGELVSIAKKDVLVFRHPDRNCLYEEAQVCIDAGLDDKQTILEQTQRYRNERFPLEAGLAICGVLVRKNTEKVRRLNELWWTEICCGSHRDQISFPYVFRDVQYIEGVNCYEPNQYFTRILK